MSLHLGVDAGGTNTRCVLVDESGGCRGYGTSSSGNPISAGPALAARSVAEAAARALEQAACTGAEVAVVVLAMAGASALSGPEVFAAQLHPLGIRAPVSFAPDLLATFCSGTWRSEGYALVAGTGAAAVRVEGGAVAEVADGLGWLLGDDGSGFWIGRRVARAAVAELDRRGPRTALTALLLAELGLQDDGALDRGRAAVLQRLIEALYALRPVELARFARLAFGAGADGDAVAETIVSEAADALARTLGAVTVPGVAGPIVLGGGTLARHDGLLARLAREPAVPANLPRPIPQAERGPATGASRREVIRVGDGTIGAAVLALRAASVTVDADVFARIRHTLAALR